MQVAYGFDYLMGTAGEIDSMNYACDFASSSDLITKADWYLMSKFTFIHLYKMVFSMYAYAILLWGIVVFWWLNCVIEGDVTQRK
ncbi:hypothetical protein THF1C08_10541 [Vibrio jasicida]|uniref:Uncharacterized protein n=1 Tax=Vibrio jasicida TaxID=766224 RepID=A0AAU9QG40_9VIBR|nr:hypothetical protein THF1C08_10541 [Vibrio jasicida]CAH1566979.1 hypothetical protein THF1A12_10543 [Vibrio jasicida]